MNKNKLVNIAFLGILTVIMALMGYLGLNGQQVEAAPALYVTPIANMNQSADSAYIPFRSVLQYTADGDTAMMSVGAYEWCDVQYIVDTTTLNTTTVTSQFSMNNDTNYVTGPVLANAIVADGTNIVRIPVGARYMSFDVNLSNSNPITFTILGLCK